jgi:hypothetical protein
MLGLFHGRPARAAGGRCCPTEGCRDGAGLDLLDRAGGEVAQAGGLQAAAAPA